MGVDRFTKKVRLSSREQAIRLQLMIELVFMRGLGIIDSDMNCLIKLAEWGPMPLKEFCNQMVMHLYGKEVSQNVEKYHLRNQSIRNRLNSLDKRGLVIRAKNGGRNMVGLNPKIGIESTGQMLLEYNFLYIEAEKDQRPVAGVGQGVGVL
jgi:hypothetical protein